MTRAHGSCNVSLFSLDIIFCCCSRTVIGDWIKWFWAMQVQAAAGYSAWLVLVLVVLAFLAGKMLDRLSGAKLGGTPSSPEL